MLLSQLVFVSQRHSCGKSRFTHWNIIWGSEIASCLHIILAKSDPVGASKIAGMLIAERKAYLYKQIFDMVQSDKMSLPQLLAFVERRPIPNKGITFNGVLILLGKDADQRRFPL